jgi:hypothetical protein
MSLGGFGTYGGLGEMGVINAVTPTATMRKPATQPATLEAVRDEQVEDEKQAS